MERADQCGPDVAFPAAPEWLGRSTYSSRSGSTGTSRSRSSPSLKTSRRNAWEELRDLALALADCRHPTHDPALARWQPSAYHVPKLSGAGLFEYRCRFPMRVIARWVGPSAAEPEGVVLLVAVTLSHDHRRLRDVLARNRSDLRDWP